MEFSRQQCWSGLPFPSPGDLPHPGIKLRSPGLQADSLPAEPPGKSSVEVYDLTVRKEVGSVPSRALLWRCHVSCSLLCWPKWKNLNEFFGHLHIWEVESKAQKEHSEHAIVVVGEVIFNVQAGCVPVEGVHNCEKPECPGGMDWPCWDHHLTKSLSSSSSVCLHVFGAGTIAVVCACHLHPHQRDVSWFSQGRARVTSSGTACSLPTSALLHKRVKIVYICFLLVLGVLVFS